MQNQEINPALVRLYYLQQLGITAYAPRVELAGALEVEEDAAMLFVAEPSVSNEASFDAEPSSVKEPSAGKAPPMPNAAPRAMPSLDEEFKPERKTEVKPAAPQVAARPLTTAAPQQRSVDTADNTRKSSTENPAEAAAPFQLLFTVVSPELAVVLQIPALSSPALREPEARLLQNLLRWLGLRLPEGNSFLPYRWPLPGLPASGAEAAGRSLHVFMQQAAAERPFTRLLLLGATPAEYLQQHYQQTASEWQCWSSHSLAELLALPELKRDTWLQLQSLHAQLLPTA